MTSSLPGNVPDMATPTYLGLADALEEQIRTLDPGTRLPAETKLAETWGVNRLTARAAMEELERRYLIRRRHGSGTFVARRIDYLITQEMPPSWSHTVRLAGAEPRSERLVLRTIRPSASVNAELGLPTGSKVVRLVRRRYVDDELATYAETHVAADLVPGLAGHLTNEDSLHRILADTYRLTPRRAWINAELEVCPAHVAEQLNLRGRGLLLRVRGRTDSERRNRPVEITTTWMRPDLFRLVFAITDSPRAEHTR